MATPDQLDELWRQADKIITAVRDDALDADRVLRALQDITEGNAATTVTTLALQSGLTTPDWWRTTDQQLNRARQLWSDVELPQPPANFVSQTRTEVLLLHVPRPLNELWDLVEAPQGYTKWHWKELWPDRKHLRLAPNVLDRSEPVWLGFDYAANRRVRPNSLWGRSDLAASEVLSAVIQFPDWSLTWFSFENSAPNLTGFQIRADSDWLPHVPSLLQSDSDRQLSLGTVRADYDGDVWCSPVVREL